MKVSQEGQWHLSRHGYLQGYCAKSAPVVRYPNALNRLSNPQSWPKSFDISFVSVTRVSLDKAAYGCQVSVRSDVVPLDDLASLRILFK